MARTLWQGEEGRGNVEAEESTGEGMRHTALLGLFPVAHVVGVLPTLLHP